LMISGLLSELMGVAVAVGRMAGKAVLVGVGVFVLVGELETLGIALGSVVALGVFVRVLDAVIVRLEEGVALELGVDEGV
jgi:hypothetical protein